jgi:hypothetical protein
MFERKDTHINTGVNTGLRRYVLVRIFREKGMNFLGRQ